MSEQGNPLDDWMQLWTRMMKSYPTPKDFWAGGDGAPYEPRELMERMTQAQAATVDSGARYVARWTELSSEVFSLTSRAMVLSTAGADGASELGTVMDELRAAYRKMAELPLDESRRLQSRLAEIWRPETPPGDATGDRRRTRSVRIKN